LAHNPAQFDADFYAIINAWPKITPAIKAKLLKLIRRT
jgi:hypothetical protein